MEKPIDIDSLWKQYQLHVDLYKHYLDLTLRFNVFYYAVTGAILSFYFSRADVSVIRYSLLFPVLMSIGFGLFAFYAASLIEVTRQEIFAIRDALGLHTAPEVKVLAWLLRICAGLFVFVALCLVGLFFLRTG
jgi:hypothetical protein